MNTRKYRLVTADGWTIGEYSRISEVEAMAHEAGYMIERPHPGAITSRVVICHFRRPTTSRPNDDFLTLYDESDDAS